MVPVLVSSTVAGFASRLVRVAFCFGIPLRTALSRPLAFLFTPNSRRHDFQKLLTPIPHPYTYLNGFKDDTGKVKEGKYLNCTTRPSRWRRLGRMEIGSQCGVGDGCTIFSHLVGSAMERKESRVGRSVPCGLAGIARRWTQSHPSQELGGAWPNLKDEGSGSEYLPDAPPKASASKQSNSIQHLTVTFVPGPHMLQQPSSTN